MRAAFSLTLSAVCLYLTFLPSQAQAQTSDYSKEYVNRIKSAGAIQPLGETPFGESIDLYTGATSFEQTDLVLEGIGPPIRIMRRSLKGDVGMKDPLKFFGFGDWDLEIPEIVTLVPGTVKVDSTVGIWSTTDASGNPTAARCTNFGGMWSPPFQYYGPKSGDINLNVWWRGYELRVPGHGSQTILARAGAPAPASGTYPGVTTQHWQVGCLAQTTNGQPGEAFLVLAPDGTKYFLTHLTFDTYQSSIEYEPEDPRLWRELPRNVGRMKATRVEDRFGNYITYGYTGDRLTSISASDGRALTIEWWSDAPLVKSITSNGRTWNYNYASRSATGGSLSQVVLPDGSAWGLSGGAVSDANYPVTMEGCLPGASVYPGSASGVSSTFTITHPAGVVGTFRYSTRLRAQSYLPMYCTTTWPWGGEGSTPYESANPYFLVSSLVERQVSGPGLATALWTYDYEVAHASADRDCAGNTCQSTTYTDVVEPDNTRTRYIHSTRYGALQGKLLRVETYQGGSTLKRIESKTYNYAEADRPYPGAYGSGMTASDPPYAAENLVLLRKNVVTQDGRNFTWEVPTGCSGGLTGFCFDAFGKPTKTVKSSGP